MLSITAPLDDDDDDGDAHQCLYGDRGAADLSILLLPMSARAPPDDKSAPDDNSVPDDNSAPADEDAEHFTCFDDGRVVSVLSAAVGWRCVEGLSRPSGLRDGTTGIGTRGGCRCTGGQRLLRHAARGARNTSLCKKITQLL